MQACIAAGAQRRQQITHLPSWWVTKTGQTTLRGNIFLAIGELCNGSTYDSDSYCLGSNPSSPAISLHGQAVKTLPSQGKIMGSIPIGGAKLTIRGCGWFF